MALNPPPPPAGTAPRTLGLGACLALVVGNMIGSGVFLLPASLAPFGWSALGGWAVTIAGTLCLAACFSALARAFPQAGGPYVYVTEAFGREAGFVIAWSYWIGLWVGNAALAVAVVSNLAGLAPVLNSVPGLGAGVAVAVMLACTAANLAGAQVGTGFAKVTTVLKLLPLLAVLVLGLVLLGRGGSAAVVTPPTPMNGSSVMASLTLTMWAMLGFESATIPADKVRDPGRLIPLATMIGTALTGIIYLLISALLLALVPAGTLARSPSPFADFVRPFVGDGAAALVALFAAIAALGAVNGWVLVAGEMPRAMALDGVFPRWFAGLNGRQAPGRALLFSSGLTCILVLANYSRTLASLFGFMLLISTSTMLLAYLAGAVSLLWLRGRVATLAGGALALVAVGGVAYAVLAIVAAGAEAVGWGALLLLAGVPVLLAMRRP